jgi:hypothetical protein
MKNVKLRLAIFGALGLASAQAFAAGTLCALPAAPTGSAYIDAYNTGRVIPTMPATTTVCLARTNFGTNTRATSSCTVSDCAITSIASEITPPLAGYTLITSATRSIPTTTGGGGNIGNVLDLVFRKAGTTPMCIIGTRATMINADHDSGIGGTQYFEINDIARGGYSGAGTVNVGYFLQAAAASPAFRIGRTYTSVQHRAYKYAGTLSEKQNNGTGYIDLPTIAGSSTLDINGVNSPILGSAVAAVGSAADQDAQVNSNWVDFTADTVFSDDDGATNASSAMTYVEFACNNDSKATIDSTWVKAGAISLRQTAQENTTFKRIDIDGFAPPGATVP